MLNHYETDGVPAPSDFELEALDNWARQRERDSRRVDEAIKRAVYEAREAAADLPDNRVGETAWATSPGETSDSVDRHLLPVAVGSE